jgi:biotin carboxyl carrier protein
MRLEVDTGDGRIDVELLPVGEGIRVRLGDRIVDLDVAHAGLVASVLLDGRSYEVALTERDRRWITVFRGRQRTVRVGSGRVRAGTATGPAVSADVLAPMPGRVLRMLVSPGDEVVAGQAVVVIEAMKMENELRAPRAGRVRTVVREGEAVDSGALLVGLE